VYLLNCYFFFNLKLHFWRINQVNDIRMDGNSRSSGGGGSCLFFGLLYLPTFASAVAGRRLPVGLAASPNKKFVSILECRKHSCEGVRWKKKERSAKRPLKRAQSAEKK